MQHMGGYMGSIIRTHCVNYATPSHDLGKSMEIL
jgi:hypothetical protein